MADYSAVRGELQAQLDQLLKGVRDIEAILSAPGRRDAYKTSIDSEDEDALSTITETIQGEIAEIRLAIDLIDNERYGRCTICHKEISPALLAVIPYATRCVACDMSSSKP